MQQFHNPKSHLYPHVLSVTLKWMWGLKRCEVEWLCGPLNTRLRRCGVRGREVERMWGWVQVRLSGCEVKRMQGWQKVSFSKGEVEKMWGWVKVPICRSEFFYKLPCGNIPQLVYMYIGRKTALAFCTLFGCAFFRCYRTYGVGEANNVCILWMCISRCRDVARHIGWVGWGAAAFTSSCISQRC